MNTFAALAGAVFGAPDLPAPIETLPICPYVISLATLLGIESDRGLAGAGGGFVSLSEIVKPEQE